MRPWCPMNAERSKKDRTWPIFYGTTSIIRRASTGHRSEGPNANRREIEKAGLTFLGDLSPDGNAAGDRGMVRSPRVPLASRFPPETEIPNPWIRTPFSDFIRVRKEMSRLASDPRRKAALPFMAPATNISKPRGNLPDVHKPTSCWRGC